MAGKRLVGAGLIGLLLLGGVAAAQGLPSDPILRIETGGQHTATIQRLTVDSAERILVTGSHDKTVRVWDLHTGELLRVLRPPIGRGHEGKVYAVALGPDGKSLAVGGWMQDNDLYIFNPATGELVRRIGGLPNVTDHLVWSPDGARLAAVLGTGGLRVFQADGTEVGSDPSYETDSYGAVFTPDGGLATTCYDGQLRRYDSELVQTAKVKTPGGTQPYSVALSPDGQRLAVGYVDTTAVDLFDATTLAHLGSAETADVSGGNLSKVAFARDGSWLAAAGRYFADGYTPIMAWPLSNSEMNGAAEAIDAATNGVMDLRPLSGGALAFASGDPMWGVVKPGGSTPPFIVGPATADLRGSLEGFRLAADGAVVAFGYQQGSKEPATFSLAERTFSFDDSTTSTLQSPRISAAGVDVTDWEDTASPKLNGAPVSLQEYEMARSLAIASDGATFALGGEWWLRLFSADGVSKWQISAPGTAWGVNIPEDGRTVVAAFGDGTIRWYRHSDGAELLAFFPHADRERWVLWTPTGYYDCSPGAEELIGWHVNNGPDHAADFFPASRFRDRFYRPDVIDRVLVDLDEGQAVRTANHARGGKSPSTVAIAKALPPVVTVTAPTDSASISGSPLTVTYSVRTADDAPVTRVWALVDGRPVENARALGPVKDGATKLSVPVPSRDCEIAVLAENRNGISVPFSFRVGWVGTARAPVALPEDLKPKVYALVVGVSDYQKDSINDLAYAAKDAKDFAAAVKALKGGLYRDVEVKLLTDAGATRDDVADGLDWLSKSTTSRDVAMLFMAGHGVNDANNVYYYLPHNADPEKLLRTGVRVADVRDTLSTIAGKALFFVDTCHSGNVLGGAKTRGVDVNGLVNELTSAENGAVVFTASTGRQSSLESPEWENGAFTKAVVEGLSGRAAQKGKVTIATMDFYISERVKELTGGRQTPVVRKPDTVPDFPIALGE